tara:strand:+ start:5720 stop:6574 length:855 start_codon:yes stop_codon:yes gene_type:complete
MMSDEFKDYYDGIMEMVVVKTNNIPYAESLVSKNYFRIKTGFYEDENPNRIVEELVFEIKEHLKERGTVILEGLVVESKFTDGPIRGIVRSLVNIIKSNDTRTHYLPEELSDGEEFEYEFKNIPRFSIEFNYDLDPSLNQDYTIVGRTVDDGYTIEIIIVINPSSLPNSLYNIIGELNDIVAHEIEHIYQEAWKRPKSEMDPYVDREDERPNDKEYYKQPHEIPAELKGFKRVNKLRKEPIEKTIKDWFERNKSNHNLNKADVEELTKFLIQKYYEKYGNKLRN